MQHHRQLHQDLPAIPETEEVGADDASSFDEGTIDHVIDIGNDDDVVDGDGDNGGAVDSCAVDDSPNVEDESCANSYAFTLDNVGWDEECSLVGSVVSNNLVTGSLFGGSDNSSTHSPPSQYGPEIISEHTRNLHREICQKFGLPYSEDWLNVNSSKISSGSDSDIDSDGWSSSILGSISIASGSTDGPLDQVRQKINKLWSWSTSPKMSKKGHDPTPLDKMAKNSKSPINASQILSGSDSDSDVGSSILGSTSITSGSADEPLDQEHKQKIDKLWPWPTSPEMSKKGHAPMPLNKMAKNSNSPTVAADTKNESSLWVKESWTSFNRRVDNSDEVQSSAQRSSLGPDDKNRGPDTVKRLSQSTQHLVHGYRESSVKTKLRVGVTMVFLLLSFIVILVSVGRSKSDKDSSYDRPDFSTNTPTVVDSIPVGSTIVDTNSPTFALSLAPAAGPQDIDMAPDGVSNEESEWKSCNDADGRFQASGGKKRQCEWLSLNVELGALYSDLLYAECGEGSELGLNCRYTCRAYNGCLLLLQRSGEEGGGSGQANEGGGGSASPTFQASDTVEMLTPATVMTDSPTPSPMDLQRSAPVPSIEVPVDMEEELSSESEMTLLSAPLSLQTNTLSTPSMQHDPSIQDMMCVDEQGYYLNHNGQPRQCSWLINTSDPTDETRRIHNCGYADSNQYSVGTDLGKMCKKTCGTC
jgi:hypothetical protein